jgi:hypothetical protein
VEGGAAMTRAQSRRVRKLWIADVAPAIRASAELDSIGGSYVEPKKASR